MADFIYSDGGREDAGYKGQTGDCVLRAIAIATGLPYAQVRTDLMERTKEYRATRRTKKAKRMTNNSAFNGVYDDIYKPYLLELGWQWVPCTAIGSKERVHVCASELPNGTLILRLSRHLATWKDGMLHDTHDCSRGGQRMVYGYFKQGEPNQ